MLLMQEPQVLLLDEPVAGMTDAGTMRSAELSFLAGRYTLVVVEHDVDFVARIAHKVTVLHEGSVLAEGSMEQISRTGGDRSLPRALTMLRVADPTSITAAAIFCATSRSTCRAQRARSWLQRCGQATLLVSDGLAADPLGDISFDGAARFASAACTGGTGNWLRAPGTPYSAAT
jgi:ABC-type sulfate/molybdate transport systems ATPase subunit